MMISTDMIILKNDEIKNRKKLDENLNIKKMKNLVLWMLVFTFISCTAQEKEKNEAKMEAQKETDEKPKAKWNVYREYDEDGNLIKYDSTYVWSYSNIQGDSLKVNLDSVMDSFRGYFEFKTPFIWEDHFMYFPKNDSLLKEDFFRDDYYFKNWERDHSDLEEMIKKMDSVRNQFLKEYHPGLKESAKKVSKVI